MSAAEHPHRLRENNLPIDPAKFEVTENYFYLAVLNVLMPSLFSDEESGRQICVDALAV